MKPLSCHGPPAVPSKGSPSADGDGADPLLLDRIGISHLYASPLLTARAGSTHGYDIVDHNVDQPGARRRAGAATPGAGRCGPCGWASILDIVPNHMGVGGNDNAWWLDVLEWGRSSPYAEYFDIDWDPPDATLRGRMLAPFLGSPYGEALATGELVLHVRRSGRAVCSSALPRRIVSRSNPREYAACC